MSETNYCELRDVAARLSGLGVALAVDDDPSDYPEAISEASSVIEEYLLPHYAKDGMADNRWVRQRCAWIAAGFLMERRGNAMPKAMLRRLEAIEEAMEEVASGKKQVPGLVRRRTSVPTLSSPRVILGPTGPRVVIDRWRGTRRSQPRDYQPPRDLAEPPPGPGGGT